MATEKTAPDDGAAAEKDYTGQGTGGEMVDVIESEEQLRKMMGEEGQQQEKKKPAAAPAKQGSSAIPEELEEEEGEEEEEEYTNMVDYLNKDLNLGLSVENLPENLTKEQEAEIVSDLFRRAQEGFSSKLEEYASLDKLLKDKDVSEFLRLRKEGKTLKDIASQYASASASAPDDVVVAKHLKAMYPTLTEAEINEQVGDYRTKNKLDKMASAAREYFKADETRETQRKEEEERQRDQEQEQEYQKSVQNFARFVQGTNKVWGVVVTPEMKKRVFAAVTHRDDEGITEHDRHLQSEAGTFMSALGMFYMKQILQNETQSKANKGKRRFIDSLITDPGSLRSGSEATAAPDFDVNIANRF